VFNSLPFAFPAREVPLVCNSQSGPLAGHDKAIAPRRLEAQLKCFNGSRRRAGMLPFARQTRPAAQSMESASIVKAWAPTSMTFCSDSKDILWVAVTASSSSFMITI
jgi:hypothetical protein